MRHAKPQPIRNNIDLADPSQIRILRRRLGMSAGDLQRVVEKVGNSIAAVCKEIEPQKAIPVTEPTPVQIESPSPSEVGMAPSAGWCFGILLRLSVGEHEAGVLRARCSLSERR